MSSPTPNKSIQVPEFLQPVIQQAAQQFLTMLFQAFMGLINKKPKDPVVVTPPATPTPNVPTSIPAPPASSPEPGEVGRRVSRVRLKVAMAEFADAPGHMYTDAQQRIDTKSNFNFGSKLWLDLTAFDEESEEWRGHSIIAADLEYRTALEIYKNGALIAFIRGQGGDEQNPRDWQQQVSDDVHFGQRAWKDSVGFNTRTVFDGEGVYDVVGYVMDPVSKAMVESNHLEIHVS
jgi:hypothetical protein